MDQLTTVIREIVRDTVAECLSGTVYEDPELITMEQAAKLCGCDKSTIAALVSEAPANGFPSIRLSRKTIRIDKRRLAKWFAAGGLGANV